MSIVRPIVRNIVRPIVKSIDQLIARYLPEFNGTSQYGDLNSDWAPTSINWRIQFDVTIAAAARPLSRILWGDANGRAVALDQDSGNIRFAYWNGSMFRVLSSPIPKDGYRAVGEVSSSASGVELIVGGTVVDSSADTISTFSLSGVAANTTALSEFFFGAVNSLQFIDDSDPSNTRNYPCDEPSGNQLIDLNGDGSTNITLIGGVQRVPA